MKKLNFLATALMGVGSILMSAEANAQEQKHTSDALDFLKKKGITFSKNADLIMSAQIFSGDPHLLYIETKDEVGPSRVGNDYKHTHTVIALEDPNGDDDFSDAKVEFIKDVATKNVVTDGISYSEITTYQEGGEKDLAQRNVLFSEQGKVLDAYTPRKTLSYMTLAEYVKKSGMKLQ